MNFRLNILQHRAETYGTAPALAYLGEISRQWSWGALFIVPLISLGAWRYPALFWTAIANLLVHMVIAHKEYRYIFLSIALFVILAGIGSGDAVERLYWRWPNWSRRFWVGTIAALWLLCSAGAAFSGNPVARWQPNQPMMEIYHDAGQWPNLCGIAAYRLEFWQGGGYFALDRPAPMYHVLPPGNLAASGNPRESLISLTGAANAIIAKPSMRDDIPTAYHRALCRQTAQDDDLKVSEVCLFVRPGICKATAASRRHEVNHQLLVNDW